MNYKNFYYQAQKTLVDSLVSFWMLGKGEEQKYIRDLLTEKEPLITEPIFQSIFPWEPSEKTLEQHASEMGLLSREFVDAISSEEVDEEYRFPKDRHPYKHQTSCWKGMLGSKSKTMVVTSGTGSGKTECFMIPVLQDIMNSNEKDCIQAIFLYPLNALMKSQQRRMDAWCRAIPNKITYAIYNHDTERKDRRSFDMDKYYPQLITRPQIRRTPPQILFTNPTMLNYMLVRKEDMPILEKSKGKLKWILLDEAHSYTGSAAAELALQLRRVMEAFGVTADQVKFAITSATIGDEENPEAIKKLKAFVSQITDKPLEDIEVIGGKRIVPKLNKEKASRRIGEINKKFGLRAKIKDILCLREKLNKNPILTLDQIIKEIGSPSDFTREQKLEIVDMLGDKVAELNADLNEAAALLPTRAHFFIRSINGLYACVNDECEKQKGEKLEIGSLTSIQSTTCSSCGSRLLEIAKCPSCGEIVITGEESVTEGFRQSQKYVSLDDNLFNENADTAVDDLDLSDIVEASSGDNVSDCYTSFCLGKADTVPLRNGVINTDWYFDIVSQKIKQSDENTPSHLIFKRAEKDSHLLCPHCANKFVELNYLRASSNFLGRILAPILLENAQPMSGTDSDMIYDGRKYISFNDSRQGAARSAMQMNQAVERNWFRAAIYHKLADLRLKGFNSGTELTSDEKERYDYYKSQGDNMPPFLKEEFETLQRKLDGNLGEPAASKVGWNDISGEIENSSDFRKLFRHLSEARFRGANNEGGGGMNSHEYLTALFVDQFGWIPKRANSLETMGLVRIVYPDLERAKCPDRLLGYGITDNDWQSFLKICIDYVVRGGRHYIVSSSYRNYLTQNEISTPIYPADSTLRHNNNPVSKWPRLEEGQRNQKVKEKQSRVILLLCAGIGIYDVETITNEQRVLINDSLEKAWNFVRNNVLTCTDDKNKGYKLNLMSPQVKLQIITDGWICPVDAVIVDTVFKGFSPRINGYISAQNFSRFKVSKKIHYPFFPFKSDAMKKEDVKNWVDEKMKSQMELGVFSELIRGIYEKSPIYISAEHSAQQNSDTRDRYEKEFSEGKLNILSCSTTMEMGVDIGGVSEVVMNNVPPRSANYLQRAGRAGRRKESKTLVLTFCAANPVGSNTWAHPEWPINHATEMPVVKMESHQVIQRHINSYLFAHFVNQNEGMNINENLISFFGQESLFDRFLDLLDDIFNGQIGQKILNGYNSIIKNTIFTSVSLSEAAYMAKHDIVAVKKRYEDRRESLQKVINDASGYSSKKHVLRNAEKQKTNFENSNLLSYLAENSFLPSAGIPTGLVECELNDSAPSMHISQAISSYAPGTQVVKNEWCYEPAGIVMKTRYDDATTKYSLQQCSHCGYATISYGKAAVLCPKCGSESTMRGVNYVSAQRDTHFTEVVEPAGFTIEYNAKPTRIISTRRSSSFIQPILLEMDKWPDHNSSAKMEIRTSTPESQILFYNKGTTGNGYAFCPYCGRMESERAGIENSHPLVGHKHLRTLQECEGGMNEGSRIRRNVLLVGRYQTDFVELRFYDKHDKLIKDPSTLYSLGVIISRCLIEVLGIDDGEVDFGYNNAHHSIFIYDTVLGGAGYSTLLRDYRDKVLEKAKSSLESCRCDIACSHCLIDRKSQWYINYLNRLKALEWLETEVKARNAPADIKVLFPDAVTLTTDFSSEIYTVTRDRSLRSIGIFLSGDLSTWHPDTFPFRNTLNELELNGVSITYMLDSTPDIASLDAESLSMLLPILMKSSFHVINAQDYNCQPLIIITMASGAKKMFFGSGVNQCFDESWGEGAIYITSDVPEIQSVQYNTISEISRVYTDGNNCTFLFEIHNDSSTDALLSTLESYEGRNWEKIRNGLSGRKVDVNYTDRYLYTPLGCYMLARLLRSIRDKYSLTIRSITLSMCRPNASFTNNNGIDLGEDFCDENSRNEFIKDCIQELLGIVPIIANTGIGYRNIRHDRCLSISDESVSLSIRPDAGIAYGWAVKRPFNCTFEDLKSNLSCNIPLYNRIANHGILYTIVYKEK